MTKTTRADGPFDTLEATFRLACRGPRPWSLDGRAVPGLPDRLIPLDELRAILLHPSTSYRTRGRALSILVARARSEGGAATVGLAGVLLFGLRRAVAPLCDIRPDRAADIEAEALAGLVEGIAATEAGRPRLAARLCWLARNRAKRLFETELGELASSGAYPDAEAPTLPVTHPDLVLAQAVIEGVITGPDAALIGETRFGVLSLEEAADALGVARWAAFKRRRRAELNLAEWLGSDDYDRRWFVQSRGQTPYLGGGGRPRGGREADRRSKTCP
jgi:hypothetical protein